MKIRIAILIIMVLSSFTSNAKTYYLSETSGLDTNSGTSQLPWKTLSKAQSAVQQGDTVLIRNGNYGVFTSNVGAVKNTNWINYIAENGQNAVHFDRIVVTGTNADAYLNFENIDIHYPAWIGGTSFSFGTEPNIADFIGVNFVKFKKCKFHGDNQYETGGAIQFNHLLFDWVNPSAVKLAVHDLKVDSCEIYNTPTGVRFSGYNINILNNHIYQIHGTIIGQLAGGMGSTTAIAAVDSNSCRFVLIENNHLHYQRMFPLELHYSASTWGTTHSSVIGCRGADFVVRGNHIHDTYYPLIQLYGNEPMLYGKYDKGNLLFENNIIYDHGGSQIIYNPGSTEEASISGPVIFRHNTVISGNQDVNWNNTMTAINRFRANATKQTYMIRFCGVQGDVLPTGEALPFINTYNYDGTGSYFEDNVLICEGNLYNYVKSPYISPNIKFIYRNNLIYGQLLSAIPLDASNINISDQITKGKLPKDYIDTQLFLAPNYNKAHGLTYASGSAFDLTPKPGSVICTLSTTGSYVGAIKPANLTTLNTPFKNDFVLQFYPNPTNSILHILLKDNQEPFSISLCDLSGRTLCKTNTQKGDSEIEWDLKQMDINQGVYMVCVKGALFNKAYKVVIN